MQQKIKVGVFDSGIGGKSVANAIETAMPEIEVIFANDTEHVPYGNRDPKELEQLTTPIMTHLTQAGCQVIVIACNTVATTIIEDLRQKFDVPFIALEPMVKPAAAQTKTKKIAVCATPTTLASKRYKWLKDEYAQGITVIEPDCSDWSYMIENNQLDHQKIDNRITEVCQQGADVIVLGCTHYHWIEKDIKKIANKFGSQVIQPEQAIVSRLKTVLESL